MFDNSKYTQWYNAIIESAKIRNIHGYVEKHHIVPKSMAGSNSKDNIVALTAREHFLCHWLLTKMVDSPDHVQKMNLALGRFVQNGQGQDRILSARHHEVARLAISKARTGSKHTDAAKNKMSESRKNKTPWNKGLTGFKHSAESNLKRSQTMKGKSFEERVGDAKAQEMKKKISEAKKGHTSGMTGRTHSDETKQKMREKAISRNQKVYIE